MIIKNKRKKNQRFFSYNFFAKNPKGVSVMIGYIFLITITIVISTIVYQQLRTYVPTESIECPEGVSVFLKEVTYDCNIKELNITLKNNGRFSVAGYFITAADSPGKEIATIDLSGYNNLGKGGAVIFDILSENSMNPDKKIKSVFDLSNASSAQFYSLNIIPVRYQEIENRNKLVSCGDSRIKETLTCIEICLPNNCFELGYICGEHSDGCGGIISCGTCTIPDVCTGAGQCVLPVLCTDNCSSLNYQCGDQTICGVITNCGACVAGFTCDTSKQCTSLCGNGVIDSGEGCDDGNTVGGDGCTSTCTIESGFVCSGEPSVCEFIPPSVIDCSDYCVTFPGFTGGGCLQNPQQCSTLLNPPGTYIGDVSGANASLGDSFCTLGNAVSCCCQP